MAYTGSLIVKDPNATLWPRGIDWTNYLSQIDAAETITASIWLITGSDATLTQSSPSIVLGSTKTQVRLSAGTVGLKYTVTNRITTSSGVIDDRSFTVFVQEQ